MGKGTNTFNTINSTTYNNYGQATNIRSLNTSGTAINRFNYTFTYNEATGNMLSRSITLGGYGLTNNSFHFGSSYHGSASYDPFDNALAMGPPGEDEPSSATIKVLPFAVTAAAADGPVVPVGDAIGAVVLAGAVTYDLTQRVYITYTLTNPATGQIYAGRASGFGDPYRIMMSRYYGHHMRHLGFANPTIDKAAQGVYSYPAIRGREQQLIDFHGGIGHPKVGNTIRGVSKMHPVRGRLFHNMSNLYFGNLYHYTGY